MSRTADQAMAAPATATALSRARPWLLVAAYDVSLGESSEGYVAFNVLRRLAQRYRIVLLTRRNNQERLSANPDFKAACAGVRVLGFDLPRWASWWKRGSRFYGLYAYLWQLVWPLILRRRKRACNRFDLVHVLNFHNDSIPSSAWSLGRPVIWGPVNHHELVPSWRREFWPSARAVKYRVLFSLRSFAWNYDPFLWITKRRAGVILSAGPWVDRRLRLQECDRVVRLSQLGVDDADFSVIESAMRRQQRTAGEQLVYAGRLDWLKGVDVAIEALVHLPETFRLLVIGKGPAENELRRLVKRLKLDGRIDFRPPVSRSELAQIYASASLFLFTSPEVAGLAWIEALACGLPVVGFVGDTELAMSARDLPGMYLAKSADDRAGYVRNYALTINEAAMQTHDRMVISEAVLARYGWDRMVAVMETGYRKAYGGKE